MTYFFILVLSLPLLAKKRDWKLYDKMPIPVAGAEIVTWENKIYILGGYKEAGGDPVTTIQMYDPAACLQERWSVVGNMQIPRANFVAKLYANDSSIYIAGGASDFKQENVSTMERWNLKTYSGEILDEDIELNRTGATGEIWRNYLIIIGGYNSSRPDVALAFLAVYDLERKKSYAPPPQLNRLEQYNQATITLGDSIYIFGGVRSGISQRIYNINLNAADSDWPPIGLGSLMPRVHPDLDFPRASLEAVKTSSDTVWLIGGYSEDSTALRTTSKFIIKNHGSNKGYEHHPGLPLLEARKEHSAAAIDSVIYVFGGVNGYGKVLNTVEAYIDTVIALPCTTNVVLDDQGNREFTFRLKQNAPNPFNNSTMIEFDLPSPQAVRLDIYTARGQWVTCLVDHTLSSGAHRFVWDGRFSDGTLVPSGIYLYKLTTDVESLSRKMLLVK